MKPWLWNSLVAGLLCVGGAYALANFPRPVVPPKDLPPAIRAKRRRLAFAGAHNFRDLGGYTTADGARLKWGVLYRSDNLHRLTTRDQASLAALGLTCIVDFRADFEKQHEPNRLPPNPRFRVVELPIFDANSRLGLEIRERIKNGDLDGIDPAALLTEANIQFATNFTPQFKAFVREVLAAQGKPVLFHCTAGKDRTGFAAAVLLRLLGVPQDIVLQDYLLSQANILSGRARDLALGRLMFGTAAVRVVEGLLSVNAVYLQAAFDTIDAEYGSFDAYVRDGLGLTSRDIATLRAALLEA